jgi:Questin oxidase-like
MIAWLPAAKNIYKYLTTGSSRALQSINIPSVEIHEVETMPDKRPRTLKHLLKANHANFAIFSNKLQFHNHMPHILCSAYLLGANTDQLHQIYDVEAKELDAWSDSPAQIADDDWKDYLGDRRYERAYVDFFEDELALKFGYDWKRVADEYLFSGEYPLVNCVITGREFI